MSEKGDFKSIRLQSHDYSVAGSYFITINTYLRTPYMGHIIDGKMIHSPIGKIARQYWLNIPKRFPDVIIEEFVIMPDHMHGIITIVNDTTQLPKDYDKHKYYNAKPPHPVTAIHELRLQGGVKHGVEKRKKSISDTKEDHFDHEQYRRDRRQMLIPKIVGWYKMNVGRESNLILRRTGSRFWQKNYYEHIIRNDKSQDNIRQYILDNPRRWKERYE